MLHNKKNLDNHGATLFIIKKHQPFMSPLISGVQRNPDLFRDQKTKLNAQTKKAQPLKQWEPIKTTMMRRVFHTLVNAFLIGVGALQFTPRSIHGAHFNLASSPQTAFVFCFGAGDCFSRSDAAKGLGGALLHSLSLHWPLRLRAR